MKNVGSFDASVRLVLSIAALYFGYMAIDAMTQWALYIIAFILIWTSVTGHCFVYSMIGMTTCTKKAKKEERKPAKKEKAKPAKKAKKISSSNAEKYFGKNVAPTVAAIRKGKLSKADLKELLKYEKKNKKRKTIIKAINDKL